MKQKEKPLSLKELGLKFKESHSEKDFNLLHKRIKTGLYQYAYRMLNNHHDASDVVTTTMTKVWSKIDQFNPEWHISTWIYSIAYKNGVLPILHNRKNSLNSTVSLTQSADDDDNKNVISKIEFSAIDKFIDNLVKVENEKDYEILVQMMLAGLSNLPSHLKEPLASRYFDNLSYDEISLKYDINLQTVKNRIFKAKQILKEDLKLQHQKLL